MADLETSHTDSSSDTHEQIIKNLTHMQKRDTEISNRLWSMFELLEEKTLAALQATAVEDFEPTQLPALVKSCTHLMEVLSDLHSQRTGVDVIAKEVLRLQAHIAASDRKAAKASRK